MKTQPHPSEREVLAGLVDRVTYQNAENGRNGEYGIFQQSGPALRQFNARNLDGPRSDNVLGIGG